MIDPKKLKINDTLIFYDGIRKTHHIGIFEGYSIKNDPEICDIHSSYGPTVCNILSFTENLGNIGNIDTVRELYPEYFV